MSDRSFEALMSEHHNEIYRYLLRVTGRSIDAEDLSQEAFLRAFRAYRSLPPDANARAWLFAIATNLARNHFRAHRRRREAYAAVSTTYDGIDGSAPDGATISRETGALVERVVAKLPLKQRLAFLQRKVHGLDYETIGQHLGSSADTARAHVFQAMRKIRQALDGHELLGKELPA